MGRECGEEVSLNETTVTTPAIHQSSKTFETTRDVLDVISATPASASAAYGYNNRGELISADEVTNVQDRAG